MTLIEKIQNNRPKFADDVIEAFDRKNFEEKYLPFCREYNWYENTEVNTADMIGTQHPDYIGLTWEGLIYNGKRMHLNLPLSDSNPGYYFTPEKKEPAMDYIKLGGKYYVNGDGNHRTAIAKFLFHVNGSYPILKGVAVQEYDINFSLIDSYHSIRKTIDHFGLFKIEIIPTRKKLSREDGSGWMREKFETTFVVKNRKSDKAMEMRADELEDFMREIPKLARFRRYFYFGKYKDLV